MTKMFEGLKTWNPYVGCRHNCYNRGCWAVPMCRRIGGAINCSACQSFIPHFHPERLNRIPRNPRIFVSAHGDMFGHWVTKYAIMQILDACNKHPKEMWFFETKNPGRYGEFIDFFPENTVLSTTIETNRFYPDVWGIHTPSPRGRFEEMRALSQQFSLHVSHEPLLEFDLDILVDWDKQINPVKVAVGFDSRNNNLPEPSKDKALELIDLLEEFTEVERKGGL